MENRGVTLYLAALNRRGEVFDRGERAFLA
jgi:hypothetical protein